MRLLSPPPRPADAPPPPRRRERREQPSKASAPRGTPPAKPREGSSTPPSPSRRPPPRRRDQQPPSLPGGMQAAGRAPGAKKSELERAREHLSERLLDRLRRDQSEYAIGADDDMLEWMCDVALGDPDDTPVTTQSNLRSNWRHWERFCAAAKVKDLWRPDVSELDAAGRERETVLWTSALTYIYCTMKPKPGNYIPGTTQLQPPKPESALAVLRGIRREHIDRGINPPPLTLAARRMHELTQRYSKWVGPENLVPRRKATLTHEIITGILNVEEGAPVSLPRAANQAARAATTDDIEERGGSGRAAEARQGRSTWTWRSEFGESIRALIHVLAQTGFRKAEVALGNEPWSKTHISFANVIWVIQGKVVHSPSVGQLSSLQDGDYAIITPPPSKADPFGRKWGNHPIYLPFSATAAINAARALARWELCAAIPADRRRSTPLFCGTQGVGTPLRQDTVDAAFYGLLTWRLRSKSAAHEYSIHSFRSYLASSMLEAQCSDAQIMAALRWSSAEALEVYKNTNKETYGGWLLAAEGQRLTGFRAINLARPLPQTDHIRAAQAIAAGRRETLRHAAEADLDRGSPAMAEIIPGRAEPAWRWEPRHRATDGGARPNSTTTWAEVMRR